jgi:hypothetical protein
LDTGDEVEVLVWDVDQLGGASSLLGSSEATA